jgi:hypothetical protein
MTRTTTNTFTDPNLLEAALEGLMLQKQRIESQIQEVRAMLGRRRSPPASKQSTGVLAASATPRRELSEAARKRIAAAQKKRWAEYRKKQARAAE